MAWKRFPVPEFEYRSLKAKAYSAPEQISAEEAARIVEGLAAGDRSLAGGYAVAPDAVLLEKLDFRGDHQTMVLCALPGPGAHLLGRSNAWFNQRAFILDRNAADAETLFTWRTPRPMNTRFGPEDGLNLETAPVYVLSGRIVADYTRGNRVMIDNDWAPGDGREGFRIIAACDEGADDFHDSCFEFSWQA